MAIASTASGGTGAKKKVGFWESQKLAKQRAYEKQARTKKIKTADLAVFTQQLAAMLDAGLPLVTTLEALQDQTENPVFKIVLREVRQDIASGTSFSEACRKFPNAFPNLFVSMVEAGEASGALAEIMAKVAGYFEDSVKLSKKVKSAMTYPVVVISIAVILVTVLLIFVIPVFEGMFKDFGSELPKPTQFLIDLSHFLGPQFGVVWIGLGLFALFYAWGKFTRTPKGRRIKCQIVAHMPILGNLSRKIAVSRFCRTYATLIRSGVPILRALEICSKASNNTYIEDAVEEITRQISQGGQLSETVAQNPYFPAIVKHMAKAGEQTGNVDGMMNKIADFFDEEINNIVSSLTSLMEPILIVVLGVIIGGIVMAMFLPIFEMGNVVAGN
jgi:type IV pilus assembly protein PilC